MCSNSRVVLAWAVSLACFAHEKNPISSANALMPSAVITRSRYTGLRPKRFDSRAFRLTPEGIPRASRSCWTSSIRRSDVLARDG